MSDGADDHGKGRSVLIAGQFALRKMNRFLPKMPRGINRMFGIALQCGKSGDANGWKGRWRMNVGGLGLFQVAEKRLAWVDQRQKVLAQNVANADTPGWKARDIGAFAKQLERTGAGLVRTDPMHLRPIGPAGGTAQPVKGERAPDGNNVSLDEQLAAIADTESAHGLTSDLYKKYLSFFRLAIGR